MGKCWIFCAGEFDRLLWPPQSEDYILCADGGLCHAQRLGLKPHAVLGDFDSLGYTPAGAQVFPVEKDDTDAMLAVRQALSMGFEELYIYGGLEGERVDHTVANFQTLSYIANHGARGYLVGKSQLVTVLKNETVSFPASAAGVLSLFCLGADAQQVTARGLRYCMESGILRHDYPLGVSNHFIGEKSEISVKNGELLMIWSRESGIPERRRSSERTLL